MKAFAFANRVAKPRDAHCDVAYERTDGAHFGLHGGAILPDILRRMWRDYAK